MMASASRISTERPRYKSASTIPAVTIRAAVIAQPPGHGLSPHGFSLYARFSKTPAAHITPRSGPCLPGAVGSAAGCGLGWPGPVQFYAGRAMSSRSAVGSSLEWSFIAHLQQ